MNKPPRIAKFIADAGYCSRREAEKLIADKRVEVDGEVIAHPALLITNQVVKVDGKLIRRKTTKPRMWLFHKPKATLVTNRPEAGKTTIFELLPKNMPRLIAVGRLDFNTEGLLLLTDNGELARFLELPKNEMIRKYRVRVFGLLDESALKRLGQGVKINGILYQGAKITVDKTGRVNSWITIEIKEGKNREIRKLMESIGLQVSRLIRTNFGPYALEGIAPGEIKEVRFLPNYLEKPGSGTPLSEKSKD